MHHENFRFGGSGKRSRRAAALVLAGAAFLTTFSGCSVNKIDEIINPTTVPVTEPAPTEPPVTVPPDGDPENVSCKGSYTVDAESFEGTAAVASMENQELSNSTLNILYRLAVNAYVPAEGEPAPDFSKPLDTQICELEGSHITWQQYFLQRAIDTWQGIQALERGSHMKMVRNELNFEVDPVKHDTYMKDVPINDHVLYGADASFRLTIKEEPYLEELPDFMEKLAHSKGYGSLREMVAREFGSGIREKDFNDLVQLINYSYFYFVSLTYDPKPEQEDLDAILADMPASQEELVDMRHILIWPEGAQAGADGKVTADEAAWEEAWKLAQDLDKKFHTGRKKTDAAFSKLAHDNTKDDASRATGGKYINVHKGQMIEPLDQWLFDPLRQAGDTGIVQSEYGLHVLYLTARKDARLPQAEAQFRRTRMEHVMEEVYHNYPMTLDYSKIQLLPVENQGKITLAQDILYEDIGHERFAEVPVYIQQDYMKAPYGGYKVSSHGCGISALAMLSTYMMDEQHTPATLGVQFGYYNGLHGTDWTMFTEAPPELGYYLHSRAGLWDDVEAGLKKNQMAISLQVKGYFTRAGHYLVISELRDDGDVVIRDSNIYNYTRLKEHKVDHFNPKKLLPNCQGFWIYEPKVVTVPNCARCGDPQKSGSPRLFREDDYLCHKCIPAQTRREIFLDLLGS